jgi:anti-sigma factor RsiW
MKLDNPRLTAFALGELPPDERSEFEQMLRSDRDIAAEIEETREIARILRDGLCAEAGGELANHQRDAIFREVELLQKERGLSAGSAKPSESEVFAPLVVPRSTWWNRPGPWQAIAACTVAGFAAYALFVNVGGHRRAAGLNDAGEIIVQVPNDLASQLASTAGPQLVSPGKVSAENGTAASGIGDFKAASPVPKITPVVPEVNIDLPKASVTERNGQESGNPSGAAPDQGKPKGRYVVGAGNPEVANRHAAADIARADKKPGAAVDDKVAVSLKEKGLRAGSTYEEFLRVFEPVPGTPGRYRMIKSPSVEVDAEFTTPEGQPLTTLPTAESRVKQISKPYLE